jgi:hypothetical protein
MLSAIFFLAIPIHAILAQPILLPVYFVHAHLFHTAFRFSHVSEERIETAQPNLRARPMPLPAASLQLKLAEKITTT